MKTTTGGHTTGILFYSAGIFFFSVNDALGKWLVADYTVGQLMLLRTVGAMLILGPMIWREGFPLFDRRRLGLQILRIVAMAADTFAFYWATISLPLADVMTFYMAAPLVITVLSAVFLGEKVGVHRWTAVAVGFVGVVIALRPTEAAFSAAALIAFLGAVLYAFGVATTRKLREVHWLQLVVWQFGFAGLVGGAAAPAGWVTPGPFDLGLMFLVGITAMVCFILITKALRTTPASVLAPFQYTAIVWAALLGWAIWGDVPTVEIVVGNLVICLSGLYVFHRERVLAKANAVEVEPIP